MTYKRRDYTLYPTAYTDLLMRFISAGEATIGPLPRKLALTTRADLYRFKSALRASYAIDPHARTLYDIFNQAISQLEPAGVTVVEKSAPKLRWHQNRGEESVVLRLVKNPILVAMEAGA